MDPNRPMTPRSPINLNPKYHKYTKSTQNKNLSQMPNSKISQKVTTVSLSQRSDGDFQHQQFNQFNSCKEPCMKSNQQLLQIKSKLAKEQEKNYIYRHFFKKIQKVLYNQNSQIIQDNEIKNYEKLELHLTDMIKRIQKGSQYCRLAAVPVIYKKQNTTTTTRNIIHRPVKR